MCGRKPSFEPAIALLSRFSARLIASNYAHRVSARSVPNHPLGARVRNRSLLIALLCLGLPGLAAPSASAQPVTADGHSSVASRVAATTAKVTAPDDVTEGDRYKIRVKLKTPSAFRVAAFEQRLPDIFGNLTWQALKRVSVRGRRQLSFGVVAGGTDRETFRVVLQPTSGRPFNSKPVNVDIWHWYPLSSFPSYYATQGIADDAFSSFFMNGRSYIGSWSTDGTYRSWESRYTLGRHCRTMSGTFGVTDDSTDGSSATIQVVAEGVYSLYTSPSLTPGAVDTQTVELPTPYRISVIGTNTSPDKVLAYPAAGDLVFLCTGLV